MTLTDENIRWLQSRGYEMKIDHDLNENFWQKDHVQVSIHSIRGIDPQFFKAFIEQKEKTVAFQFEVIEPASPLLIRQPSTFQFEAI